VISRRRICGDALRNAVEVIIPTRCSSTAERLVKREALFNSRKAGHPSRCSQWMPAFAGMTSEDLFSVARGHDALRAWWFMGRTAHSDPD